MNYVPIDSQQHGHHGIVTFTPAVLNMAPGETQFWRVANSTADTILDLQVLYDGVPQTLQIVAIDAVPVNSQDGTQQGQMIPVTRYRLPVAGRVEFLVTATGPEVHTAQLITNNINTGPQGDCDPTRPVFNVALSQNDDSIHGDRIGKSAGLDKVGRRFAGLEKAPVVNTRYFQFSEIQPTQFFITEVGQTPVVFDNNNPPAVTVKLGTVEKWVIQNLAQENHEFHMHQIHFQVLSQDNFEINGSSQAPAIDGQ